jgi:hypothetical protein
MENSSIIWRDNGWGAFSTFKIYGQESCSERKYRFWQYYILKSTKTEIQGAKNSYGEQDNKTSLSEAMSINRFTSYNQLSTFSSPKITCLEWLET